MAPILITLAVLIAGTIAVHYNGYFQTDGKASPMAFKDMRIKIVYDRTDPELLAYIPPARLAAYQTIVGGPVPEAGSMVLGYDEARDMTEEANITISQALWGYTVKGFIGKDVKVSGMLKRTDSLLDMMHVLPEDAYDSFPAGEPIDVKYTEDKMPKFFYYIRRDGGNWPKGIRFSMGGMLDFEMIREDRTVFQAKVGDIDIHVGDNRTYLPLVLGAKEAKMMMDEGMFSKPGERIRGFFGKDVVIAGVLEPTGTALDMMHYMPGG